MIETRWVMPMDEAGMTDVLRIRSGVLSVAEEAADEDALHLLAGMGGVWYASGRVLPAADGRWFLERLCVLPGQRRKGLADMIARMLIRKAYDLGAEKVCARVPEEAVPFFRSLGFLPVSGSLMALPEGTEPPHLCERM